MIPGPTRRLIRAMPQRLLAWFDLNKRSLPFRETRDPYRVWVSEVMLQQTTVAAVVPYYERFIEAFPTVVHLARAEESQVLKLWEGLGYYRRAKHLHGAAKILAERFGNDLPDDPEVWAELSGVGRYILGAVLSRAFDRKLPIVEANSLRVLARLRGFRGDPRKGEGKKWVWRAAEESLPEKRAGDFNESLMELGALVCTPEKPKCRECPIGRWCVAKRDGLQSVIPPKPIPQSISRVREVAVAIRRGKTVLLGKRPEGVRWAGMWELPHGEIAKREAITDAAIRIASDLVGLRVILGREVSTVQHTVTRFDISMTCLIATAKGRAKSKYYTELKWVSELDFDALPLPIPQRKMLDELF